MTNAKQLDIPRPINAKRISRRSAVGALGGGLVAGTALGGIGFARPESAGAATGRSLEEFLDAQGSTADFLPPYPDFIGWFAFDGNPPLYFAYVDYAGVVAEYLANQGGPDLDTRVRGTVTERPLSDGGARVTVVLHTTNALSWAVPWDPGNDVSSDPLHFGYRPAELVANPLLAPALGECQFQQVFKNTAPGAPLPDLGVAFAYGPGIPGVEAVSVGFRARAEGHLRAPFGVAEGTPGMMTVSERGIFSVDRGADAWDGFPAEHVNLRVVGAGVTAASKRSSRGHRRRQRA